MPCELHGPMEKRQQELQEVLIRAQDTLLDLSTRVSYLEAGMKNSEAQLTKLDETQNKLSEKFDKIADMVTEMRVDLPVLFNNMVSKNREVVQQELKAHIDMEEAKGKIVVGGLGNTLLKLLLAAVLALLGLDVGGVIDLSKISPKSSSGSATQTTTVNANPTITIEKK